MSPIKEGRSSGEFGIRLGRREYTFTKLGRSIVLFASVAAIAGSCVGTIMHIVGWDFVSVRGHELKDVQDEIRQLHHNDTVQLDNQVRMQEALDSIKGDLSTQTYVQCVILRRMDPSLLPRGCPTVDGRQRR